MAVLQTAPLTTWVRRPKFHQHDHYVHGDHGSIGDLPVLATDCNMPSCNLLRRMLIQAMKRTRFFFFFFILLASLPLVSPMWGQQKAQEEQEEQKRSHEQFSDQHIQELLSQGKYRDAEQSLRSALERESDPLISYRLGRVLMQQYRYTEAEFFLRQALEAEPHRHRWLYYLSTLLREQNRCSAAIPLLERCLDLEPSPTYSYMKAKCALNIGNFAMAEQDLRTTLAAQKQHPYALYRLGKLLADRGDTTGSLELLQQAVAANPNHVEAHFTLGLAQRSAGQLDAAVSSFRTVLAKVSGHVGATYNLGLLLAQMGKQQESRAVLSSFRRLQPIQEKIERLQQSVLLNPNLPEPRTVLGQLYLETGQIDAAVTHLEIARRLAPGTEQVHRLLAQAYKHQGKTKEAARAERFATSLSANQPSSE